VPFVPLPPDFVHIPFGVVLARVQGAMQAMGFPLAVIDGLPLADEGSPIFLRDVADPPGPMQRITPRSRSYCRCVFKTAAIRNMGFTWATRSMAGRGSHERMEILARCGFDLAEIPRPSETQSARTCVESVPSSSLRADRDRQFTRRDHCSGAEDSSQAAEDGYEATAE
jgi:hypothetical protein